MSQQQKSTDRKYPTNKLLKSKQLSGYQPDFAKAILTDPEYSIKEARRELNRRLKGGGASI